MKIQHSEQYIAALAVDWLEDQGWEVFQEVQPQRASKVADIVAVKGSVYFIVEVKKTLGLAVIQQAAEWYGYAHMRAVAVPPSVYKNRVQRFAEEVASKYGVGVLRVSRNAYADGATWRCGEFDHNPKLLKFLKDCIRPEHKYWAAAGSQGKHFTAFKGTVIAAKEFLKTHPGSTIRELVDGIAHHYSTDSAARSTLGRWVSEGVIKDVRRERDGKMYRYYLKEVSQ